jgi:hypothetical protein
MSTMASESHIQIKINQTKKSREEEEEEEQRKRKRPVFNVGNFELHYISMYIGIVICREKNT